MMMNRGPECGAGLASLNEWESECKGTFLKMFLARLHLFEVRVLEGEGKKGTVRGLRNRLAKLQEVQSHTWDRIAQET